MELVRGVHLPWVAVNKPPLSLIYKPVLGLSGRSGGFIIGPSNVARNL